MRACYASAKSASTRNGTRKRKSGALTYKGSRILQNNDIFLKVTLPPAGRKPPPAI
ncbi:hypothetical protein UUU_44380 [Klebsiella pneumoniae subsp. pneumoniae DSM 30104 = JCM 1662 = NBRC 14940]|nr:hypothetical protein UUU_44380 [Klebsiella pneumoniae subsp. pneumoniae DSM 30104 = JCM 1662 = NBRC 14940]